MTDLISRRAAIKAIDDLPNCYNGYSDTYDKAYIIGVLEELPRVDVPDRKVGKWEHGREIARTMLVNDVLSIDYEDWHCSCCGRRYKEYVLPYNFCPNCGAQMERFKE